MAKSNEDEMTDLRNAFAIKAKATCWGCHAAEQAPAAKERLNQFFLQSKNIFWFEPRDERDGLYT